MEKNIERKKSNKLLIKLIIVIFIIILVAVGVQILRTYLSKSNEIALRYTVKKEVFDNAIEISGNISAASEQNLNAAGNGTVQKVYVKEGDFVKKGQVILELDVTEQEYNIASLDYDIAQAKISGAQREIELMQIKRAMLVKKLEDRKVYAYFDGIVVKLTVAEGDYLEAKDEVGVLIDRSYMTASVEIVETDVSKLKQNQEVNFSFPAYPDIEVKGYVYSFPAVGTVTSRGTTVVNTELRIDNPPDVLLPHFSFTGQILITAPQVVYLVERQAIGYRAGKTFAQVYSGGDDKTYEVEVEVKPYDSTYVSIISGLSEGDVLKAQSEVKKSGGVRINSNSNRNTNGKSTSNANPSGFGDSPSGFGGMPSGFPPR